MRKFTKQELKKGYALLKNYHDKFLSSIGVLLPRWNSNSKPSKDLLVLLYLAQGYPNTRVVSKQELTSFIQLYDPKVTDVQQARHLANVKGWYIASGTRNDQIAINDKVGRNEYKLISLEFAYPGWRHARRNSRVDATTSEELKASYGYRCATCGSVEGKPNIHYPSVITKLQQGHMDPSKPLTIDNMIPQCESCNRAYRNWWKFDEKGRVDAIADECVVDRCSEELQKRIFERLKSKFQ